MAHYAGRGLQVAKHRGKAYPESFRRMALDRMKSAQSITALAMELGVGRRLLYTWRDRMEPPDMGEKLPPPPSREGLLERENARLKRVLAEKTLELSDVAARQPERGADVFSGRGQPRRVLPEHGGA